MAQGFSNITGLIELSDLFSWTSLQDIRVLMYSKEIFSVHNPLGRWAISSDSCIPWVPWPVEQIKFFDVSASIPERPPEPCVIFLAYWLIESPSILSKITGSTMVLMSGRMICWSHGWFLGCFFIQQPLKRLDYCSFCCMLVGMIPCHVFGHFRRGFCLHLLQL